MELALRGLKRVGECVAFSGGEIGASRDSLQCCRWQLGLQLLQY